MIEMVSEEKTLGYVTDPDDYLFLSKYVLSEDAEGVLWDELTAEELQVVGRFNRIQYHLAPHVLEIFREGSEVRHVVANFNGPMADRPPYQMGQLRIKKIFGHGIVLYYHEAEKG